MRRGGRMGVGGWVGGGETGGSCVVRVEGFV